MFRSIVIVRLVLLGLLVSCCGHSSKAQDSLITKQLSILSAKIDSLSQTTEEQPIGIFKLNLDRIDHYNDKIKTTIGIYIDSITLYLKDGYILDVHVYTGTKQFTNQRSPIDLHPRRLDQVKDWLRNPNSDNESIIFQQIMTHDSLTSYIPENGFYKLTRSVNKLILYRQTGINTVFDLRIYTDALGLFGNDPNGVVQTEARYKQMLNNSNKGTLGFFFFKYLKINFNASKFTSANNYVDSAHFSRTSLLQQSFINADLSFNLISTWLGFKSVNTWYLDGGLGYSETKLARGPDTSNIGLMNWFFETGLDLKNSDYIGFNVYFRLLDQFSPSTDWENNNLGRLFGRLGGEVVYNTGSSKTGRLFARTSFTFSTSKDDTKHDFFQLQLGYSVLLSSLIKK